MKYGLENTQIHHTQDNTAIHG